MEQVAILGDSVGTNTLTGRPYNVHVTDGGRYWISVLDAFPLTYDVDRNRFEPFGKAGGGPGEYRRPAVRAVINGDSVLLSDLFTLHVLGPDLKPVRSLHGDNFMSLAVLHWPDNVLGITAPHDRLTRTFRTMVGRYDFSRDVPVLIDTVTDTGANDGKPIAFANSQRRLGRPTDRGDFWIFDRYRYRLVRYSAKGEPLDSIERIPRWFPAGESARPGSPQLIGAWEDSTGVLWVLAAQPRRDPEKVWDEISGGRGGVTELRVAALPAEHKLYRTIIEAVDLRSRRVIARHIFDGYITAVLPQQLVASYVESDLGIPILSIHRLTLTRGN